MAEIEIAQFLCLTDNIGVLVHDGATGATAAIDAPHAETIQAALNDKGWRLTHILTTHWHGDHVAGNVALKAATECKIAGPRAESAKIPGLDAAVAEGDVLAFGAVEVRVLETPGHTAGHAAYWMPALGLAFTGDALFAMGCGRIFEGSAQTMWESLQKIAALPRETKIYCGHEYTVANAKFALTVEPENAALQERAAACEAVRASGALTLPTTLALELETNPFLRAGEPRIQARLGMTGAPPWQAFAELRERKNRAA